MECTIELTGPGTGKPTSFTYAQLKQMPMVRLDDVLQRMSHYPDQLTSWRGPSLEALLEAAEVKAGPLDITLEATDGYRIDCTRDDLRSAVVALQDGNGRWLTEVGNRCPLRLVPPHMPGNYWVANLRRIVAQPADDPI